MRASVDEPLRGGERHRVDSQADQRTPEEGCTEAVRQTDDVRAHATCRRHRDGRRGRHRDDPTTQSIQFNLFYFELVKLVMKNNQRVMQRPSTCLYDGRFSSTTVFLIYTVGSRRRQIVRVGVMMTCCIYSPSQLSFRDTFQSLDYTLLTQWTTILFIN